MRPVSRPSFPSSRPAFTVVEVLVALAVFALAALVLGGAYVNVLASYQAASRRVQNAEEFRFARSQLALQQDRKKAEEGQTYTTVDGRQVVWSASIETTSLPELFQVVFTCEISGSGQTEPERQSESFRLLRPSWAEGAERDSLRQALRERILELKPEGLRR